ncbi:MAG: TlpA disulfide reductase family protein [Firmicutes bacterium]|nr:TlpA disulfide reductase family protein [Bacillota bacterium]
MSWRNSFAVFFLISAVLLLWIKPHAPRFSAQNGEAVGAFTVHTRTNATRSLAQLLHHRPGEITFWATWCPACRQELPVIARHLSPTHALILISEGRGAETSAFLASYHIPSSYSVYDPSGRLFSLFEVTTLPTSYFVNASGHIVSKVVGPLSPTLLQQNLAQARRFSQR